MPHKDPEARRAYKKAWAQANPRDRRAYQRAYTKNHPHKLSPASLAHKRAYNRAYAHVRREQIREEERLDPALKASNAAKKKASDQRCYFENQARRKEAERKRRDEKRANGLLQKRQLTPEQRANKREKDRQYRERKRTEKLALPPPPPRTTLAPEERQKRKRALRQRDYAKNRDKILVHERQKRLNRSEEERRADSTYFQAYRLAHIEKKRINDKLYKQANPDIVQRNNEKRRANKANAPINDLTPAQWRMIQEVQDHCCAYCEKRCKGKLTKDHITPFEKGGSHTLHNIVAACRSCNSRKHTGPPLKAVQPLLL
jgi:hypothetical protein